MGIDVKSSTSVCSRGTSLVQFNNQTKLSPQSAYKHLAHLQCIVDEPGSVNGEFKGYQSLSPMRVLFPRILALSKRETFLLPIGGYHRLTRANFTGSENGAWLIITDGKELPATSQGSKIVLLVKIGRMAWSLLYAYALGNPEKRLKFFGITGTNGKTSALWILRSLLKSASIVSLSIGTLGIFLGEEKVSASTMTTPDPPELYPLL